MHPSACSKVIRTIIRNAISFYHKVTQLILELERLSRFYLGNDAFV